MNKGLFVLHGGGAMRSKRGENVERDIIEKSENGKGKLNLTMLNIAKFPEAREEYLEKFKLYYEKLQQYYNIKIDQIIDPNNISESELDNRLGEADIIYLGGGNPLLLQKNLTNELTQKIVDEYLHRAKTIVGRSAGGIIFGEKFLLELAEPLIFEGKSYKTGEELFLPGIGYLKGIISAHFSNRNRQKQLEEEVLKTGKVGYGLDEHTTMTISGDNYEIFSGNEKLENGELSNVYKYSLEPKNKQTVIKEVLTRGKIGNSF